MSPLDPMFPPERIQLVLEDAEANVLLTEKKQLSMLKAGTATQICIDADWPEISKEKDTVPDSGVQPENLAYVMYTSGSTGKPKGVQIEHRSVINFLNSMRKIPGFTQQDILLAVTTLSFDISVLELYLPLTTGGKVVVLSDEKTADGNALIQAIDDKSNNRNAGNTASYRLMLEAGWKGNPNLKLLCGGEPLPSDLARELIPRCSELWNMYGPTETTIWSTCVRVTDPDHITIGRPIDNTDIYIYDDTLQPLPDGVEGELLIGGDGLARGYNNLPEMTNQKFIPHPEKKGNDCIEPVMWLESWMMAPLNAWAEWMIRSNCTDSESSWVKSRRIYPALRCQPGRRHASGGPTGQQKAGCLLFRAKGAASRFFAPISLVKIA